jgi:uncharacterized protein
MVVVFDTNVWISAMHFRDRRSPPVLALEYARNQATIAICAEIREEIQRILIGKFGWESVVVEYRLGVLLARSVGVAISGTLHACRDPKDDMILECAVASGAECIISGDRDLLVLDPYDGIRIVAPADYLAMNLRP